MPHANPRLESAGALDEDARPGASAPALRLSDLSHRYGARVAISHVSLAVERGSLFGFLGPNGAGKTTTIRILLGFLHASGGEANVLGCDAWRESRKIKRSIGYLPSDIRLPRYLRTSDAIALSARVRREPTMVARGLALADTLGLDPAVPVRAMSRGMRQKLGVVLALAHDPELLVLDEPTTALDPIAQAQLYHLLRERAARGKTVFFSSHVLSEVEDLCDHVAMLRAGALVANEPLESLRARATREVELRFRGGVEVPDPPPWLKDIETRGPIWKARLSGTAERLLEWIPGRGVEDLRIGSPDLERLFLEFYREEKRA